MKYIVIDGSPERPSLRKREQAGKKDDGRENDLRLFIHHKQFTQKSEIERIMWDACHQPSRSDGGQHFRCDCDTHTPIGMIGQDQVLIQDE
jgi:hypothetical protein